MMPASLPPHPWPVALFAVLLAGLIGLDVIRGGVRLPNLLLAFLAGAAVSTFVLLLIFRTRLKQVSRLTRDLNGLLTSIREHSKAGKVGL